MFKRNLSPIYPPLAAVWYVFFLYLADKRPVALPGLAVLSLLLPLAILLIFSQKMDGRAPRASLWAPTVSLLVSLISIFMFLDRPLTRHILLGGAAILIYLNFFYWHLFLRQEKTPPAYNRLILEKTNFNLLFLSVFLFASSLFAWSVFIANAFWPLLLIVFSLMAALTAAALYGQLAAPGRTVAPSLWLFSALIGVLAAQFFWALNLWPVGFLIKGAVLGLMIYFMVYLAKSFLLETFSRRAALKVFALCLIVAVILLFLARWV